MLSNFGHPSLRWSRRNQWGYRGLLCRWDNIRNLTAQRINTVRPDERGRLVRHSNLGRSISGSGMVRPCSCPARDESGHPVNDAHRNWE
jgi:hypothetical protein